MYYETMEGLIKQKEKELDFYSFQPSHGILLVCRVGSKPIDNMGECRPPFIRMQGKTQKKMN